MTNLTLLSLSEGEMLKLSFQAIVILVVGFVLWRVMAAISKRKSKPKRSSYFDTKYKEKWRNK